jgi:magnesium transporter
MTSPAIPSLLDQDDARRGTEAFPNLVQSTTDVITTEPSVPGKKRRNHRAGRKKKNRRRSFAVAEEDGEDGNAIRPSLDPRPRPATTRPSFFRMGQSGGRALSESSLDSEALLDHR